MKTMKWTFGLHEGGQGQGEGRKAFLVRRSLFKESLRACLIKKTVGIKTSPYIIPLTTHHSPLTTHHSPLTTHYVGGIPLVLKDDDSMVCPNVVKGGAVATSLHHRVC